MPKSHKPHGIGKFLKDVLDSTEALADGLVDRLSAAECDFRKGLTKLVEPNGHREPPRSERSR
ncbi:hypothetical protein ACIOJD_13675 [Streptomyces sp. NPDC088116]|uniref:hypothetical protein n=1 Tax=Streptomyces sp. NPDC088116 TaxID=3365825 RepID=UPI00382F3A8A